MTGELPTRTVSSKLVVVARASAASDYAPVLAALAEAGVQSVELTLTTPGTFDALAELRGSFDGNLGIGTVTNLDQLERAIAVGADYVVTPITSTALVEHAVAAGMPIVPGGLTPTELFASWSAGASAVKVFPAGQVGPGYLKDLRGPFPDIAVVPSGGVDADSAAAWLAAGAVAVSVGGPLLGDAFRGGDLGALRTRAERFVAVCAGVSA
ncbi:MULTISPECIES: bifunctional 4-hydroxy-2-oxoglutarate aldolase/2-dehydro-3-deoxy-phosphogluconate aldolase [unclassified Microbacterium]|uniref:bifunctional 4-hydroxy-2-oxoglutarate aldolase/2-dehydro-3-deoxy-phosphogluconate aldolase n=1 Tax=unclassified Microbacterium TaxID=2609290 RepID=UPI0017848C3C|nr:MULTISPECIES: bifunctional 4-hydroxy-2-oxoglutarate aldolase/2-dehydro-3-deoxy-phosphogluconate aldolase [unclassified Microbacterium]MBD8206945.1 bifunctional 4-hydroxy-2-oxoglutarate aldolase/2-dehydro-3-deoxy-phosphogluconate aldolase [Microbacterium sp. CFBP 8801]MBD8479599.1 bifunctional 4-hydroxy-2-oxoglutarate aldolase/2-dehydro-3-deoxy-phosphogluconate aldolase [Microbacterium sp. CFBP 8794]MBD8508803.1 bifunctional 4-hydroxy-2-oxoglutarate aldolase/2-dehydro-3-deoxy-phosphogluconate 